MSSESSGHAKDGVSSSSGIVADVGWTGKDSRIAEDTSSNAKHIQSKLLLVNESGQDTIELKGYGERKSVPTIDACYTAQLTNREEYGNDLFEDYRSGLLLEGHGKGYGKEGSESSSIRAETSMIGECYEEVCSRRERRSETTRGKWMVRRTQ